MKNPFSSTDTNHSGETRASAEDVAILLAFDTLAEANVMSPNAVKAMVYLSNEVARIKGNAYVVEKMNGSPN